MRKNVYVDTIKVSKELTKEDVRPSFLKGMFQALLRLLAPLM